MENLITAHNIEVCYGKTTALCNTNLTLKSGEKIGLVGSSGSGKSTLLEVLAGILKPTKGEVTYTPKWQTNLYQHLSLVMQHPLELFSMRQTLGDFLAEPLRNFFHLSKKEITPLVEDVLHKVKLKKELKDSYPNEVSGGQLQRVVIARSLLIKPQCILFDEPTSALDVITQKKVLKLINSLQEEYNFASIFVSHDLGVVQEMSDKIIIMDKGEIIETLAAKKVREGKKEATKKLILADTYA